MASLRALRNAAIEEYYSQTTKKQRAAKDRKVAAATGKSKPAKAAIINHKGQVVGKATKKAAPKSAAVKKAKPKLLKSRKVAAAVAKTRKGQGKGKSGGGGAGGGGG